MSDISKDTIQRTVRKAACDLNALFSAIKNQTTLYTRIGNPIVVCARSAKDRIFDRLDTLRTFAAFNFVSKHQIQHDFEDHQAEKDARQ
ncbi:MAG: hypothetical protein RH982_03035 [Parvibaculum sp.]